MLAENISAVGHAPFRAQNAGPSVRNCGGGFQGSEPTGRATGAPDHERLGATASGGAGGQDVAAGIVIGPEMGPVGIPSADAGHLRQMNGAAECLFDQIERVDQDAHADELARPELGELRDPQADRLV